MIKPSLLALVLAGFTFVGCAEEEATTPDPVLGEAEVVTEPEDDVMMPDDPMMMDDPLLADSTMEEGTMTEGEMIDGDAM